MPYSLIDSLHTQAQSLSNQLADLQLEQQQLHLRLLLAQIRHDQALLESLTQPPRLSLATALQRYTDAPFLLKSKQHIIPFQQVNNSLTLAMPAYSPITPEIHTFIRTGLFWLLPLLPYSTHSWPKHLCQQVKCVQVQHHGAGSVQLLYQLETGTYTVLRFESPEKPDLLFVENNTLTVLDFLQANFPSDATLGSAPL